MERAGAQPTPQATTKGTAWVPSQALGRREQRPLHSLEKTVEQTTKTHWDLVSRVEKSWCVSPGPVPSLSSVCLPGALLGTMFFVLA